MGKPSTHEVTGLLPAWSQGDQATMETLISLVYQALRRLAHRYMGQEYPGHLLQTTALVNEAYLRLIEAKQVDWQNRTHFFCCLRSPAWDYFFLQADSRQFKSKSLFRFAGNTSM